jgi:hypothetical protein
MNIWDKLMGGEPLIRASKSGNLKKVRVLLDKGADINVCSGKGGRVSYRTSASTVITSYESGHRTPLYWAIENNHTEVAILLIERGADVNIGDEFGETPLHRAAYNINFEVAELLLKSGASVNALCNNSYRYAKPYRSVDPFYTQWEEQRNMNPKTPLSLAASVHVHHSNKTDEDREKMINLLTEHGGTE